jgi:maltooligosyltrehalose trehalohydrolase
MDDVRQTLTLIRHHPNDAPIVCLMNFSSQPESFRVPISIKPWQKLLDSADPQWLGPLAAPMELAGDAPVIVQAESILIYTNG